MDSRNITREELFTLVWEKPTQQVAKDFGVSDAAVAKWCKRLQVPKPPRGYWARVSSGKTPSRPPLLAFREELDRKRRRAVRARKEKALSELQHQFYQAALTELRRRRADVGDTGLRGRTLGEVAPDLAAQIVLLIQNNRHDWARRGDVETSWGASAQRSIADLIDKLLPLARPQLLVFESNDKQSRFATNGPVVFVRLTSSLQETVTAIAQSVRDQGLRHVVMPLLPGDHAWSTHFIYGDSENSVLDGGLCISQDEIWVEYSLKSWREDRPPDRHSTNRMMLFEFMPIDCLPVREVHLTPSVSRGATKPYRDRLRAVRDAEQVLQMMSDAVFSIERDGSIDRLAIAERLWFGGDRSLQSARESWSRLETELERWDEELEAERSSLARSVLGIEPGDIVVFKGGDRILRLSATGVTLYAFEDGVTFVVTGARFRKDGTLGKREEVLRLRFDE